MAEAYTYSYEPAWQKGDVISSLRLNNIENGIRKSLGDMTNLTYQDNSEDSTNNTTDLSEGEQFGAADTHFVSKVTQKQGQIQVTHRPFNLATTWSADVNATPTLTMSVGGNLHTTQNIPTATTAYYGATKLNDNTVISNALSEDNTLAVTALGVKNAIEFLDVHTITGFGADQTLQTLSEENGKIAATFQTINISSDKITDRADGTTGNQNIANTVVKTNSSGIIPSQLLPSYVDDVIEFATRDNFPSTSEDQTPDDGHNPVGPEKGKIYVAQDTGRIYRWSGSQYIEIGVTHLDYSDQDVANEKYVKSVTQENGKINAIHELFNPSITYTSGNSTDTPSILFSVAGNNSNSGTATTFNKAATNAYGVTKLNSNTVSSNTITDDETLAVTTLGVHNIINTLNNTVTASSVAFISGIQETNGIIAMTETTFSPVLNHTVSTSSTVPYLSISIAGNESSVVALDTATTANYGVTKLSDATDNTSSDIAATSKAVKDSLDAAKAYADAVTIPKSQISDLTMAELLTPAQKNSIELFDDLINNFTFNLTLQLPTEVRWYRDDNTGVVTAVPKTFSTDTTVSYQMNDGNGWVAYDGTQSYEGNHTFKAHVSRSHIFNGTTHTAEADIDEIYEYTQESAPEGD